MNKVFLPQVLFKEIKSDERRIEIAYLRIFDIARRNIIKKNLLTKGASKKYTKVHEEKSIPISRRSSQNAESK